MGIDEKLGNSVPLDLPLIDARGQTVLLGDQIAGRPALLVLVYYNCTRLCPMVLEHLAQSLNGVGLEAGRDFDVLVVSFDPHETPSLALAKERQIAPLCRHAGAGWHFLTGSEESISRLKLSVGFRCVWDAAHHNWAHAGGAIVLTPTGKVSHYFNGMDFIPADVEAILKAAATEQIVAAGDKTLTYCYEYDPTLVARSQKIIHWIRAGGVLTVLALLSYIGLMLRQDYRRSQVPTAGGS